MALLTVRIAEARTSVTLGNVSCCSTIGVDRMAKTLADRLNRLFATVKPAGRDSFTNQEVAAATGLSVSLLRYLRSGERDNPTIQTLEALARFFGVPVAYFYDDQAAGRIDEQLQKLQAMAALQQALQRDGVQQLATRMGELSDGGIAAITQLVDLLLKENGPRRPTTHEDVDGGT
jgi:transcriptional regulator with XRE-family HTH domain